MIKAAILALGLAAAMLGGCTATTVSGPVDVTRFHLGVPLERGTVMVEPLPGGAGPSLEFPTYADAVREQLLANGYAAPAGATPTQYLAVVGFTRRAVDGPPRRSPFSIGIGGGVGSGGYGGGVGVGGGVTLPIDRAKSRAIVASELAVQIRRRGDGTVIWEGRAQTAADVTAPDAQASMAAGKMARALFTGFPGDSGRTITVR